MLFLSALKFVCIERENEKESEHTKAIKICMYWYRINEKKRKKMK